MLALAACVTTPSKGAATAQKSSASVSASPESKPSVPEPSGIDATIAAHIQKAIGELHVGRVVVAKAELAAVIQLDPANIAARGLLAQIHTDPVRYFGSSDSFGYTIQPGDTLMSIAQRFLDEPHKFYILARFNGASDPSRLTAGRTIRVPGKSDSPDSNVAASAQATPAPEDTRAQRARRLYDAGKYQQAIELLEGDTNGSGEARDVLALSYTKHADELLQKQDFDGAQAQVEKALVLRPDGDGFRGKLKHIERQREIATKYQAGTYAVSVGDNAKALDAFNAVLILDPTHGDAKKQIANLRASAVETMHRDALTEYKKQNLDKAIDLWDHVLELLPSHQSARLYRSRAIDLKTRLQQLQ